MTLVPADRTLVDHLVATTELTAAEAERVVEDVLAFHPSRSRTTYGAGTRS